MTTETAAINNNVKEAQLDTESNQEKFLTFTLGDEEYGQEILRVREIIGMIDITPLPQTPEYVNGVINLRGKIIPVIELRVKFGMPSVAYTEETCIIVVEVTDVGNAEEQFHMGVIVDSVSEVLDILKSQIEPAPQFGCTVNTEYILGMGKIQGKDKGKNKGKDKVIILLDMNKVLTQSELELLSSSNGSKELEVEASADAVPSENCAA